VRRSLSVRDAEERVRELQGRTLEKKGTVTPPPAPWVRDMESRLRTHLGARVKVKNGEGFRGQIWIDYHGREDLDRLLALLAPKKSL
jgi:ParB-like chromosome segregation protein Spo0J